MKDADLIHCALVVLEIEANAISKLAYKINDVFVKSCQLILNSSGHLIVSGMGKSGHIAKKIAATMASTGTPAFFLHPGEACHGDLGMVTPNDVILMLSNSGETEELIRLLPLFKHYNNSIISMTGQTDSTLARHANFHIHIPITKEACPHGLAPTASSTASLAMGDALAICLLQARGFKSENFAIFHPGGNLGKQLLTRVSDIMHYGKEIPIVKENAKLTEAIIEMSQKRLGMTTVVSKNNHKKIVGIFTDGDLRRALDRYPNIHHVSISDVMTQHFVAIHHDTLANKVTHSVESHKIFCFPVINQQDELVGAFNLHDLMKHGVL